MQTGNIILVHGKGFLPEIIQRFQKLEGKPGWQENHAGIAIEANGIIYISEMVGKGCVNTQWEKYRERIDNKEITVIRGMPKQHLTEQEMEAITHLAIVSAGNIRYERKNLCVEQPVRILSEFLTGNEWWVGAKKESKAAKRQICGEYVCYHYNKIRGYFPDWYKGAPIDIFNSEYFEWNLIY